MNKNKYFVIGGAALAFVLIIGGGVFAWNATHNDVTTYGHASDSSSSDTPATIGVKNNRTAGGLGQLQTPAGAPEPGSPSANPPTSTSTNASSSSSSSSTSTSPTDFKQYDKYKSSTESLSGEITAGTGASAAVGKKVSVIYKAWLTNGKLFDQSNTGSDGKPQPFDFIIGSSSVVNGLSTGVVNMQVGGSRLIVIPPTVGYRDQQHGIVPPNSVLVYQVQLVNVQ